LVVIVSLGQRKAVKQITKVAVGFEAVGLGGFDQTVQGCAGGSVVGMAGKYPVLSANENVLIASL